MEGKLAFLKTEIQAVLQSTMGKSQQCEVFVHVRFKELSFNEAPLYGTRKLQNTVVDTVYDSGLAVATRAKLTKKDTDPGRANS